ncbi:PrsW family intramembrane metalloprotease [Spirillospora sp. CA-294931]|uniref:PrsW family intramembrane metalloprotease n=1 Tax=Spirillospora sp. CA-294931 TaxID=3240042 RepID=UPI003D905795
MTGPAAARTVSVLTCLFGLAVLAYAFRGAIRVFPGAAALAAVLQVLAGGLGFVLIRRFRPVRRPPGRASVACLAWGATAAIGCALLANEGLLGVWAKTAGVRFASDWAAALSAPVNEEILKVIGVGLLVLAAPATTRGPLDGLVYGALTGLGFQVVENFTYALNQIVQSGATAPHLAVMQSFFVRVGLTALGSHWAMSAVAGTAVGFLAARGTRGIPQAVALLAAALAMHAFFDAPLLVFPAGFLVKVAIDFAVVAVLFLALRRGYLDRARRVLAADVAAGEVTPHEAMSLLKRRARRLALNRTPQVLRAAAERRQRDLLDAVDRRAADPMALAKARHPSSQPG